ncbi:MAG: DUF697 domain-containing protein [Myxococcales bacterium]|nr:DUF697 domain-containing protein [Myxococcales bacterium]
MAEEDTDKTAQAAKIIRKHMLGSLASGILPLPIVDMAILTAIQTRMAGQLAKLHDVEFSEQRARAIIGSLAGLSLAVTAGNTLGLLLPGIGKALRGIGMFTVPPATTYALGQVFNKHFESGGTVWTFDPTRAKKDYDEELKKGERVVEQNYAGVRP